MLPLHIRKAKQHDAKQLSDLICENAKMILKPFYNDLQWTVFIQYYSEYVMLQKIENQIIFCAEIDGSIVGTIALDGDFMVGFYTKVSYLKKGVGSLLLEYLENHALKNNIKTLQLAASPVGVDFYQKKGWRKIKLLNIKYLDVDFEETLMEKDL
jgi:N-acetylglutamate synthase-like GNAT family acetyltransferase